MDRDFYPAKSHIEARKIFDTRWIRLIGGIYNPCGTAMGRSHG